MRGVNLPILGHGVHGLKIILGRDACRHTPHPQCLSRWVCMEILLDSGLPVVQVGASHPRSPTASCAFTRTLVLVVLSPVLTVRVGLCWSPVTRTTSSYNVVGNFSH